MKKQNIMLCAAAFISGIINGLIGTGGGIVLYFSMKLIQKFDADCEAAPCFKDMMSGIIIAIIPMCMVSSVIYMLKGDIQYQKLPLYLCGAAAGGLLGALLLGKIKTELLKKIFAGLIIFAGVRMIFG